MTPMNLIKSLIERVCFFSFLSYILSIDKPHNSLFVKRLNINMLLRSEYKCLAIDSSTNTYLGVLCSTRCKDESSP